MPTPFPPLTDPLLVALWLARLRTGAGDTEDSVVRRLVSSDPRWLATAREVVALVEATNAPLLAEVAAAREEVAKLVASLRETTDRIFDLSRERDELRTALGAKGAT